MPCASPGRDTPPACMRVMLRWVHAIRVPAVRPRCVLQMKSGSWLNGTKLGKAKRGGYSKFRYLQSNNFAILTLSSQTATPSQNYNAVWLISCRKFVLAKCIYFKVVSFFLCPITACSVAIPIFHIPPDFVVGGITAHRKPPDVRICRLRNQSRVGTVPPATSTPQQPAC
jgi:hypothetical protein